MHPPSLHLVASVESGSSEPNGPAVVSVAIENAGETSSHCVAAVAGLPAAWYALRPYDLALAPGGRALLRLTLRPPETALGRYPFTVSVRPDATTAGEALHFTLVMSAGGALRVYPGLVMRQADTAALAATTGAVAATRPILPRLLVVAAALLVLLLLLGVALNTPSPRSVSTAVDPLLSPMGTPVQRAGSGPGTPPATDVQTAPYGYVRGAARTPIAGETRTAIAAGTAAASGSPSTRPGPVATGVVHAAHAMRPSSAATPPPRARDRRATPLTARGGETAAISAPSDSAARAYACGSRAVGADRRDAPHGHVCIAWRAPHPIAHVAASCRWGRPRARPAADP